MSRIDAPLDFDVESLPMDVFELVDSGLEVESLTAGHGMPENGASSGGCYEACYGGFCSCCCCTPERPFDLAE